MAAGLPTFGSVSAGDHFSKAPVSGLSMAPPSASGGALFSASASYPATQVSARSSRPSGGPLRAISVGPCLVRGGAEQWLIYLTRFIRAERLQLVRTVVTRPDLVDPAFVAEVPIPVEIGGAEAVRRAARECDVLLCWGLALDELLLDCRPPVCVFVAHGEGDWTRMLLGQSKRVVDHVVAVSQRVQHRVCTGFPTTVIYNGVDTQRLSQTRCREDMRRGLGFDRDDFVLGYVGRFSGEKGVKRLVEAAGRLPKNFKVLLVGWGAERPALLDQANDQIPGRYVFARADSYLGDYYQCMDAFCLPSHEEGCSLALLEALLCGRPVIVSAVGAAPELVQDRIQGLVVPGDPESLCRAAQLLHDHPRWAAGLAAEGQALGRRVGFAQRMAREYEELLDRLWQERGRAPGARGASAP